MTLPRPRHGFTLIELSVGLTILSLLAAGGLTVGGVMVEQQQFTGSNQRVAEAKKALSEYLSVNSRLPCPASPTLAPGATGFGTEDADNAGAANNCADGGAATGGIIRVDSGGAFTGAAYSAGVVRIGVLPVRALGLRDSAMSDEYGNRLLYAVSEQFTQNTLGTGAITIKDGASAPAGGNTIASAAGSNGAVFVVLSHGPDGKGAYRYQSGSLLSACGASANIDVENCNGNLTFRDTRFNNGGVAASFYDDMLMWAPKYLLVNDATSVTAVGDPNEVIYNNAGTLDGANQFVWDAVNNRVGIGTITPGAPLQVNQNSNSASGTSTAYFQGNNQEYNQIASSNTSLGALTSTNGALWALLHVGSTPSAGGGINGWPAGSFHIHQHGANARISIHPASGNVSINYPTSYPNKLYVRDNVASQYVIQGYSDSTHGIVGNAIDYGVVGYGRGPSGIGILGQNTATSNYGYIGGAGYGIQGNASGHVGVLGTSINSNGVYGTSVNSHAIYGSSTNAYGVVGISYNAGAPGVHGYNGATGTYAHMGYSAFGVYALGNGGGAGVYAYNASTGTNAYLAHGGYGVLAYGNANSGNAGVYGYNNTTTSHGLLGYGYHGIYGHGTGGGTWAGYVTAYNGYYAGIARDDGYTIAGNGNAAFNGTFYASDRRLKEDIRPIEDSLDTIMALKPVHYKWKQNTDHARASKFQPQVGMIAQDVEKILPYLVDSIKIGEPAVPPENLSGKPMPKHVKTLEEELGTIKNLEYSKFVPYLIAGMQELKRDHDALKDAFAQESSGGVAASGDGAYKTLLHTQQRTNTILIAIILAQFALWAVLAARVRRLKPSLTVTP